MSPHESRPVPPEDGSGRGWPRAIALGLLLVVLVNAVFAYVAISGADKVVSSYETEPR